MSDNDVIYRFRLRDWFLGAQMLFVAFGSLVLVPLLTGLDSNVALFTAGVGTLFFRCAHAAGFRFSLHPLLRSLPP